MSEKSSTGRTQVKSGSPETAAPPGARMTASARSTLIGAMFLMATSAIGPGFITQTTSFTVELGVAFAFAIGVSILVDIALQLNVWRVIGVSGRRAQEIGNLVLPGLGWATPGARGYRCRGSGVAARSVPASYPGGT